MRSPFNYRFGLPSPFYDSETGSFSPAVLFALNEPGVWFDPSDLTTLFTDPAGTTPVTAPGNTVGLMLDKSRGLVLGAELVVNGTFDGGTTTDWTAQGGATLSVDAGRLKVVTTGTDQGASQILSGLVVGKTYKITVDVTAGVANWNVLLGLAWGQGQGFAAGSISGSQTYSRIYTHTNAANNVFSLFTYGAGTMYFDNVSVKELPGNHATQATTTARPTYSIEPVGGRRNLLTWSEDFRTTAQAGDTRPWLQTAVTPSTSTDPAPNGTLTASKIVPTTATSQHVVNSATFAAGTYTQTVYAKADGYNHLIMGSNQLANMYAWFNLATGETGTKQSEIATTSMTPVGNGWYRCQLVSNYGGSVTYRTFAVSNADNVFSFAGNGTSGILLWGAQLETGSTATAYQRVTTQHDVTEAGVASVGYLYFDGSDDHMVTSTITPATDKAQVFTGVKKLSDANPRGLLDYGPSWTTYTGSFAIYAPSYLTGGLPAPKYFVAMKGAAGQRETEYATYAAPITNVLSTLFDISEPAASEILMRIDGVVIAPAASGGSAITGNFNNLALQIGRIGTGASVNAHLYSLITRFGPTLDAPTITSTEIWVGDKTGIDVAKNTSTTIYTRSGDTILDRANSTIERRAV